MRQSIRLYTIVDFWALDMMWCRPILNEAKQKINSININSYNNNDNILAMDYALASLDFLV